MQPFSSSPWHAFKFQTWDSFLLLPLLRRALALLSSVPGLCPLWCFGEYFPPEENIWLWGWISVYYINKYREWVFQRNSLIYKWGINITFHFTSNWGIKHSILKTFQTSKYCTKNLFCPWKHLRVSCWHVYSSLRIWNMCLAYKQGHSLTQPQ